MSILVVKSLFIPDHRFIDQNTQSIDSLLYYLSTKKDYDIYLIGWVNLDINQDFIDKIKERYSSNVNIVIWEENLGKIHLLSKCIPDLCRDKYDYVLYSDHDIIFIDDILDIPKESIIGGMVCYDQLGDNKNNQIVYHNKITICGETFYYGFDNIYMATGCFICPIDIAKKFSGLVSDRLYGNEDILIGNLIVSLGGKTLLSNKKIFHPYDFDEEYKKWKLQNIFYCVLQTINK